MAGAHIWYAIIDREIRLSHRAPSTAPIREPWRSKNLTACLPWQLHLARVHGHDGPGWCPSPWFDPRAGPRDTTRVRSVSACVLALLAQPRDSPQSFQLSERRRARPSAPRGGGGSTAAAADDIRAAVAARRAVWRRRHVRAQERDAREPGALGLYRLGSVVSV